MLAEETAAAGDHERNDHAVSDVQVGHGAAGVLDDAHEFVAEDIARFGLRDLAVVEVQVRAADGGGRYPQDDVVIVLDDRVRDVVDPDIVAAVIGQCSHRVQLLQG
ncbi:hypothetical protein D3C71_1717710 [compost metagenome]